MDNINKFTINTKHFGQIEIDNDDVINFKDGILGIENYSKYTLVNMPNNEKVVCLQSIEEESIAFLLIKPWDFFPDYDIDISDDELSKIKCHEIEQIAVFNIITLTDDISKTTANLLAPVIINIRDKEAMQIIVNEDQYKTKHFVFNQEGDK